MSDDPYVDDEMEPDSELNELTNKIIGAAIEVHKALGPGVKEDMYENAFAIELQLRGVPFERQPLVIVTYKGHEIGRCRLDFVVAGRIVVELKAIETIAPVHRAQLLGYLRITRHKLGILINFNVAVLKDGICRIANSRTNR